MTRRLSEVMLPNEPLLSFICSHGSGILGCEEGMKVGMDVGLLEG